MQRRVARIITALAVLGVVVYLLHTWPRTGADRVRHLIAWPQGCEKIAVKRPTSRAIRTAWHSADELKQIACEATGPSVIYARFPDTTSRDRALTTLPPRGHYCRAGRQVVVDGLDRGFPHLCAQLHGRVEP